MTRNSYSAILLSPEDNVICLMQDMAAGLLPVVDGACPPQILQDTQLGHKIAISKIPRGDPVMKYGAIIGHATQDIEPGEHVHLHNLTGLDQSVNEQI